MKINLKSAVPRKYTVQQILNSGHEAFVSADGGLFVVVHDKIWGVGENLLFTATTFYVDHFCEVEIREQ